MANRKLGRTTDIRMSMLRTLTTDLFIYGKIYTTENENWDPGQQKTPIDNNSKAKIHTNSIIQS